MGSVRERVLRFVVDFLVVGGVDVGVIFVFISVSVSMGIFFLTPINVCCCCVFGPISCSSVVLLQWGQVKPISRIGMFLGAFGVPDM